MTTKTIPELWIERQRLHAENQRNLSEEEEVSAAEYSEWQKRDKTVFRQLIACERAISETPAASIDDVLIKVRIAGYWVELEYAPFGKLDDGDKYISDEEHMTLTAYRDIKRLCNDPC